MRKTHAQTEFKFPEHGGKRRNAGRKKQNPSGVAHEKRELVTRHTPVHITMKLVRGYVTLRSPRVVALFAKAAKRARELGLRIVEHSLQSNHLHFICEVSDNKTLETGMRSLATTFAVGMQKFSGRKGKAFAERYHAHVLNTPTETKRAIKYVIFNHSHHTQTESGLDEFSSAAARTSNAKPPPWIELFAQTLSEPRSWLMREGWRRGRQ